MFAIVSNVEKMSSANLENNSGNSSGSSSNSSRGKILTKKLPSPTSAAHTAIAMGITDFEDIVLRIDLSDRTRAEKKRKLIMAKGIIESHMSRLNYLM